MKNYYIYSIGGKIKRQAINLNDIYPEGYATDKIPSDADIFAKIITSDTINKKWSGFMTKDLKSCWLKHDSWTNYYPNDLIMFSDAILYHQAQIEYVKKHMEDITQEEQELLKESTQKAFNRIWEYSG